MISHSPSHREEYWRAKAVHADQEAAAARSTGLTASWQRVAENCRWLAYQQAAFGKWQPPRTEDAQRPALPAFTLRQSRDLP